MVRLQSVEAKRQREKRMVQEMVALYCRKKHGGQKRLVPRMRRVGRICGAAQRPMSVHGDKNLLLQLQCTLLPS